MGLHSMAERVVHEPFRFDTIPIEDLIICKVLFERPKDWLNIDTVIKSDRKPLDTD